MLQAIKMDEFVRPLIGFFSSVGLVGVIIYGGYLVSINQMAVSELVGFILYLNLFYAPINVLSSLNESTNNAIASCQRVFELLDEESEIQESSDAQTIAKLTGRIDLQDLGFAYKKEQPVLQNINLIIEPGETVALVGSTGVGKTTISNLLNRFYDPTRGRILFDGVDLKQLKLSTIRDNISMVLQDTFLFNGTVFENIVYGLKHATKEQVIQAAKAANAHDFIESLENGYDTLIGERGFKLSGGQKQRLSIARAILRDTPILIMDEATSSLDTKTEKEIQQALDKIAIDRTTIVIAHRLSTIRHADKIVVLANREIAEVGTHDELLQHAGVYAQLCQNQQI
jgi:ATP-binding cassette subfamily B protein